MRFLLLLFCLSAATRLAQAQPTAAAVPPLPTVAPPAAPDSGAVLVFNGWYLPAYASARTGVADTTGALLSLFRNRRYAGWLFTVPFIVGMSLALPISTHDRYGNQTSVASEAISPPIGSVVLLGTLVGFIGHATRFNKAHLEAVDKDYAAGKPIPVRYRRILAANHFAEAAYLRTALRQQMEREGAMK